MTSLLLCFSRGREGGHRLGAWAACLPRSVVGLTLCVDLTLDDLVVLGARLPLLQHLHLEPWGATGYVALVPELFPQLRTLKIRSDVSPLFIILHLLKCAIVSACVSTCLSISIRRNTVKCDAD